MSESGYAELNLLSTNPVLSITAFMSLCAAGITVILGFYYRIYKQPLGNMVLSVNGANLLFFILKVSGFVYQPPNLTYCQTIMPIVRCFNNISLFMGTSFGHTLYMIVKYQSMAVIERFFQYYAIISVSTAVALSSSIYFTDLINFSETQKSCVHRVYFDRIDTLALIYMTPTIICCILAVVWYCLAGSELRQRGIKMQARDFLALILYPGVIIFCWLPIFTLDFLTSMELSTNQVVNIIAANIYQLQGVLDALAYGAIPKIKQGCKKLQKNKQSQLTPDDSMVVMTATMENEYIQRNSLQKNLSRRTIQLNTATDTLASPSLPVCEDSSSS